MASKATRCAAQPVDGSSPAALAEPAADQVSRDDQDTLGNAAIQEMLLGEELEGPARLASGSRSAMVQLGDGGVDDDAAAMWKSTPPGVRAHPDLLPSGRVGLVVEAFDAEYHYRANVDMVGDDIADFPGGPYDSKFNTRKCVLKNEEAEVDETAYGRDEYASEMLDVVDGVDHPVATVARGVWNNQDAKAAATYDTLCEDRRSHANDAGPAAERAYFQGQTAAPGGGEEE